MATRLSSSSLKWSVVACIRTQLSAHGAHGYGCVPASRKRFTSLSTQPVDWSWIVDACGFKTVGHLDPSHDTNLGLVLINTPLTGFRLRSCWTWADTHIVADGAANYLHRDHPDLLPKYLVGDLDSAEKEVVDAYKTLGVDVRDLSHDQSTTDVQKGLAVMREVGCKRIVIAGQFSGVDGRIDHTFGMVNTLFLNPDLEIAVIADGCYMCLLHEGEHIIQVPVPACRPYCSLIPLGQPCESISTRGLRWNMTDCRMEFGGLVSSSNRLENESEGRVWVKTSSPVLWTCTLPSPA